MSQYAKHHPNALKDHFGKPGGKSVSQLVRQSKEKLNSRRGEASAEAARVEAEIYKAAALVKTDTEARVQLRRSAENLTSIAALAGNIALGEVARCLFALCEAMESSGRWNDDFVNLHIASLRQASGIGRDRPDELRSVIEALTVLRRKVT